MFQAMIDEPGYSRTKDFTLKEDCREYLRKCIEYHFVVQSELHANVERLENDLNEASENLSRNNYAYFLGNYYGINNEGR